MMSYSAMPWLSISIKTVNLPMFGNLLELRFVFPEALARQPSANLAEALASFRPLVRRQPRS